MQGWALIMVLLLGLVSTTALAQAPPFPGPSDAVLASHRDALTVNVLERPYLRYLYLAHLPVAERQEMYQLISGQLNSTSRKAEIKRPVVLLAPAGPGKPWEAADGLVIQKADWARAVLIRYRYDWYGYELNVLETLALVDPHFHFRQRKVQTTKVVVPVGGGSASVVPPAVETVYVQRGSLVKVKRSEVRQGEAIYVEGTDGVLRREENAPKVAPQEKKADTKQGFPELSFTPTKPTLELSEALGYTQAPVLYADFFWWQTLIQARRAPGPGYCDLLGFKNQDEFHQRVGFDPRVFRVKFAEFVKEYRAAVGKSGVSQEPRRISVETKLGGHIWITFDNELALDDRNPLETPDDDFKFDATEQMAHLPNGLLAQGLFKQDGTRQDSAPDFIGPDKTATGNDGRIHVGLCFRCHTNGLQDVDDWYQHQFKPTVDRQGRPLRVGLEGPDYKKIQEVQEKYYGQLQRKLKPSRDQHALALLEATGLTPEGYSKLLSKGWKRTEDDGVDMARAAREVGVPPALLQDALRWYKRQGLLRGYSVLDMFLRDEKDQKPIPLRQWYNVVTDAHKAVAAFQLAREKR